MSTQSMPQRYQPSERLIEDGERLRQLYCQDGLTVREIAREYAEVGRTRVSQAIREHGIDEQTTNTHGKKNTDRGTHPPSWTDVV